MKGCSYVKQYVLLYLKQFLSHYSLYFQLAINIQVMLKYSSPYFFLKLIQL